MGSNGGGFNDWESGSRREERNSYEDDQYDGEREDSDGESDTR